MHQLVIGRVSGSNYQALFTSTISPSMFITRSWTFKSLVAPATAPSAVATSPPLPLQLPLSLLAVLLPLLPLFLNYSFPLCCPAWCAPSISAPSTPPPTLAQCTRRTRTQRSHAQTLLFFLSSASFSLACVSNIYPLHASSYSDAMYKVYMHMALTCLNPVAVVPQ